MTRNVFKLAAVAACISLLSLAYPNAAAAPVPDRFEGIRHPDWAKAAAIYEMNLRQFTSEGTLVAAEHQLPRLKILGAGIIWLMPIYPTGKLRSIGGLGSPYAVRDFRAVDPAYGTLADLQHFVKAAHKLGLHVILDWVGNHSAWDNALVAAHPDWFAHDAAGALISPPWFGWKDVVQFDYQSAGIRRYMTDSMLFWVREADVDGFRADAAGMIPLNFWNNARADLGKIKPVFMLAEWESRDLSFDAFDMTYAWSWAAALEKIAAGRGGMDELRTYYAWDARFWPSNAIRMLYVSNHDAIGGGTEFERYGPALDAAIALSVVSAGMPLIFNGQEAGNHRRLKLAERDVIEWRDDPEGALYTRLLAFRRAHPALWVRPWGGHVMEVPNDDSAHVLSFTRVAGKDQVLAAFNLSPDSHTSVLHGVSGQWSDARDGKPIDAGNTLTLQMPPWSYRLFYRQMP